MTPLQTLQALREGYPTPMSNDQLGQLLNAVAWAHRDEGLGMFGKPTGANCRQPRTGTRISRDYLVYQDGRGYDVFVDAEGKATPVWGREHAMDVRRWVAPVDVTVELPPSLPEPPRPPAKKPYTEAYAVEFGHACNQVYQDSGAACDPGMIAVHAQRAAYDYYVGGRAWEASFRKHVNAFRAEYRLPPV